ncbi:hypothetical protein PVAP13_2KG118316 [Panicum virgatum]|uniref:Uncharacterized protein n=1 Tax=Panicum virgatum TaxID=38727 RepID=A0A8T0W469_PANVG|nr:hypothetical protein PVAP13_2KG118316 [Panicum virgatum]
MFGSPRRGARRPDPRVFPGETRPHLLGPGTSSLSARERREARRALRRRAACSASLLLLPLHLRSKARLGAAAPPPSRRHPCSSPVGDAAPPSHPHGIRSATMAPPRPPPPPEPPRCLHFLVIYLGDF